MSHPHCCWQDIAYATIGVGICWIATQDPWATAGLWLFGLLAYCAGRSITRPETP